MGLPVRKAISLAINRNLLGDTSIDFVPGQPEEPLHFADFCIHLPAGPGLGVTLDQDKLRHYARG